jgi:uncharacterized protein
MNSEIFELHDLACKEGKRFNKTRILFKYIKKDAGKHFSGIIGPRGAGKSVLLKQLAAEQPDSLYISLDTLDNDESIFELIKRLSLDFKIHSFFLDEIHNQKDINAHLKKIYDFLNVNIVFTSSTAISMHSTSYDLSRRVRLLPLPFFSYNEFFYFKTNQTISQIGIEELLTDRVPAEINRSGYLFEEYLNGGCLPFALEEPAPLKLLKNILATIMQKDIPSIHPILFEEIDIINKVLKFIGISGIDGISYSSLSQNCGITKYKAELYIRLLEKAFILHQVFPIGTNVLREPKIVMALPYRLLYRTKEEVIGALREDFFVSALKAAKIEIRYLKSTRGAKTPDYFINYRNKKIVFEIGGKGKGREQFKGIKADYKLVFAHDNRIEKNRFPLFMAGYLLNL